jgi:MYXO-CTERM domain-containing protein
MSPKHSADRILSCVLCLAAVGLGGCGGTDVEGEVGADFALAQRQQAIVGGETDSEHTAVLAIATITAEEQGLCTGTLIAPNLVLTARHCVVPTESQLVNCDDSTFAPPFAPANLWVSPSTSVRGSNLFPVREVSVPVDDGALCGADIALLILNGQFSNRIAPHDPRLDSPAERGEFFTAVGFGSALEEGSAGTRRDIAGLEVVCGPEDCRAPELLTTTEFVGEQAVCDGDSGGPALDDDDQVVGVASRTGQDCGFAVYSAVSPWRDWIVEVATRAEGLGDYDTPAWLATAIAEDSDLESELPGDEIVTLPGSEGEEPSSPEDIGDDVLGDEPKLARGDSGCTVASGTGQSSGGLGFGALVLAVAGWLRRRASSV